LDFPDDVPVNPKMGMLLEHANTVRDMEATDSLKPTQAQYALTVGDKGIIAGSASDLDDDLTLIEVLDPEQHKDEYPDWADRLQNSYLLCRWVSHHDPVGDHGWFSRVKIIKVSDEHFEVLRGWATEHNWPKEIPDWLMSYYKEYTDSLADTNIAKVPKIAVCGLCGGNNVSLFFRATVEIVAQAGDLVDPDGEGGTVSVPISEGESDGNMSVELYCTDCRGTRQLDRGEVRVQGGSKIGHILAHFLG